MSHLHRIPNTPAARRAAALLPGAVSLAILLGGCGFSLHNPDANMGLGSGSTASTTAAASAQSSQPSVATVSPEAAAVAPRFVQRTPQAALIRFAETWGTWTSATIPAVQAKVAAMSTGTAREQAQQTITGYHVDPGIGNSAATNVVSVTKVIGVSPGLGAAAGNWVVTTTQTVTGDGQTSSSLPATLHINYAKLTHTTHGWVVNTWTPQS